MRLFQIDAFTNEIFKGNPAAVCIVDGELTSKAMQDLAMEMNLSETAFVKVYESHCNIRWFTPASEVPLCGHATLASAFVLFTEGYWSKVKTIEFDSLSGPLYVEHCGESLQLNFPGQLPKPLSEELKAEFDDLFGINLLEVLEVPNEMIFIFRDEEELLKFDPDEAQVARLAENGLITSAWSNQKEIDFISRYFAPNLGIKEDPVTGFMHTILTPYWSERRNKKAFHAYQASKRGGKLALELAGDRVLISGQAIKVFETEISI